MFGREGANVAIYDANGQELHKQPEYDRYRSVYQEYTQYPKGYARA